MYAFLSLLRMSALSSHTRLPQAQIPSTHHAGSDSLGQAALLNVCPPHPVWPSSPYSGPPQVFPTLRHRWLPCSAGFHTNFFFFFFFKLSIMFGLKNSRKYRREPPKLPLLHLPPCPDASVPVDSGLCSLRFWMNCLCSCAPGPAIPSPVLFSRSLF